MASREAKYLELVQRPLSHLVPDAIQEQSRLEDLMEPDHGRLAVVAGDAAAVAALLGSLGNDARTANEVIACAAVVASALAAVDAGATADFVGAVAAVCAADAIGDVRAVGFAPAKKYVPADVRHAPAEPLPLAQ